MPAFLCGIVKIVQFSVHFVQTGRALIRFQQIIFPTVARINPARAVHLLSGLPIEVVPFPFDQLPAVLLLYGIPEVIPRSVHSVPADRTLVRFQQVIPPAVAHVDPARAMHLLSGLLIEVVPFPFDLLPVFLHGIVKIVPLSVHFIQSGRTFIGFQ